MYLLDVNNFNIKISSSSETDLQKFVQKVNRLRKEKISDAETLNETFGDPLAKEWEDWNNSVHLWTPENIDYYSKIKEDVEKRSKELWEIHEKEYLEKTNPEWVSFFEQNEIFGDIYEPLEFSLYKIPELNLNESKQESYSELIEEIRCVYISRYEED